LPDNHTERLNAALEGRYHIERELGAGGMATVYLAEDGWPLAPELGHRTGRPVPDVASGTDEAHRRSRGPQLDRGRTSQAGAREMNRIVQFGQQQADSSCCLRLRPADRTLPRPPIGP
jgi:hypothetical protein